MVNIGPRMEESVSTKLLKNIDFCHSLSLKFTLMPDCKSAIHRFDSDRRLQKTKHLEPSNRVALFLGPASSLHTAAWARFQVLGTFFVAMGHLEGRRSHFKWSPWGASWISSFMQADAGRALSGELAVIPYCGISAQFGGPAGVRTMPKEVALPCQGGTANRDIDHGYRQDVTSQEGPMLTHHGHQPPCAKSRQRPEYPSFPNYAEIP